MAVSITCTSVRVINGKRYVRWSDKEELEFANLADAQAFVRNALTGDVLKAIGIARAIEAGNLNALQGRTITGDLAAAANIVRIA